MPDSDTLVRVEHVSKKFCKSLKRSLWYGVRDTLHELNPFTLATDPELPATDAEFRLPELRDGEFWAVRDVSFELKRGECLGLIGHNGAGKSTLLKMLNGLIKPDAGRIEMRGRVGAMIELGAGFNPILTGRENIYNKGAVLGFTTRQITAKFDEIVDFAEIEEFLDMAVQNYSSGMKVRLGFAVSAMMDPDVLIIDEVLAVGDAGFRAKCYDALDRFRSSCCILFVSHSMPMVSRLCDEAMVLDRGAPQFHGQVQEAVARYSALVQPSNQSGNLMKGSDIVLDHMMVFAGENEVSRIPYGSSVRLSLHVRSASAYRGLVGRVSFLANGTEIVAVTDSRRTDELLSLSEGMNSIEVLINGLHLSPATYAVWLTLTPHEGFASVLWQCAGEIRVDGDFVCGAHYHFPAQWTQVSLGVSPSPFGRPEDDASTDAALTSVRRSASPAKGQRHKGGIVGQTHARSCAFCGESRFAENCRMGRYAVLQCLACGTGMADPMPSAAELQALYRGFHPHLRADEVERRLPRVARFLDEIGVRPAEGLRFLDAGGGDGLFSLGFERLGYGQSTYVDVDPESCVFARNSLGLSDVLEGSIYDLPKERLGTYDVVYSRHVVEHMVDPTAFMERLLQCRKQADGVAVVQCPNGDSLEYLAYRKSNLRDRYAAIRRATGLSKWGVVRLWLGGGMLHGMDPPRHLWAVSRRGMRAWAARQGLSLELRTANLGDQAFSPGYQAPRTMGQRVAHMFGQHVMAGIRGGTHLIAIFR